MNSLYRPQEDISASGNTGQTPVSKTTRIVLVGLVGLGILDSYDDYKAYTEGQSIPHQASQKISK